MCGDEEGGGIDAGEVAAVEVAVAVGAAEVFGVVVVEAIGEEEGDFEVEVGAAAVDAGSGMAHDAELLAAADGGADGGFDVVEVGVETVVGAGFGAAGVGDDEVVAVVAGERRFEGVDDGAVGDGADRVGGFAFGVAGDRGDVDALVELGEDLAVGGGAGVSDEAVGAALPDLRGDAVLVAVDEHEERGWVVGEERLVVCGEGEGRAGAERFGWGRGGGGLGGRGSGRRMRREGAVSGLLDGRLRRVEATEFFGHEFKVGFGEALPDDHVAVEVAGGGDALDVDGAAVDDDAGEFAADHGDHDLVGLEAGFGELEGDADGAVVGGEGVEA